MKRLLIYLLSVAALTTACRQDSPIPKEEAAVHHAASAAKKKVKTAYGFDEEIRLKTTPVKNQGHSALCWAYAMLATIETEHLMQGDSVNLSADFVARQFLKEQTMAYRRGDEITTRGIAPMLIRLIQTYGLTHFDAYHARGAWSEERGAKRDPSLNYNILCNKLEQLATFNQRNLSVREGKAEELLDREIGPAPRFVFMLGAEYTTLEFAHSVCRQDEYESLTSFTHHPFNQPFVLEVPDNHYRDLFLNVPLDTLMQRLDDALRAGHPVCWEGDTSEPGFSFAHGIAHLQHERQTVTQARRQHSFEMGYTTDDHCMEIVGIAYRRIKGGKPGVRRPSAKYYIMKNSWGTGNPYGGYMYVSENYVRLKTLALILPREL